MAALTDLGRAKHYLDAMKIKKNNLLLARSLTEEKRNVKLCNDTILCLERKCLVLQKACNAQTEILNRIIHYGNDIAGLAEKMRDEAENFQRLQINVNGADFDTSLTQQTPPSLPKLSRNLIPTPSQAVQPMVSGHSIRRPFINLRRINAVHQPVRDLSVISRNFEIDSSRPFSSRGDTTPAAITIQPNSNAADRTSGYEQHDIFDENDAVTEESYEQDVEGDNASQPWLGNLREENVSDSGPAITTMAQTPSIMLPVVSLHIMESIHSHPTEADFVEGPGDLADGPEAVPSCSNTNQTIYTSMDMETTILSPMAQSDPVADRCSSILWQPYVELEAATIKTSKRKKRVNGKGVENPVEHRKPTRKRRMKKTTTEENTAGTETPDRIKSSAPRSPTARASLGHSRPKRSSRPTNLAEPKLHTKLRR